MKKLLLATAIAALSVSAAQAAPTVYGKVFVTTDYVNAEIDGQNMDNNNRINEDNGSLQVNSNISRLGFRGSEAITANTDVIYQLEYGVKVDDSGSDNIGFKSRDTYLGLVNKDFGQFRFGRNYTVIDYINNVSVNEGYWDNLGSSTLNNNDSFANILTPTVGNRINNSIIWFAPKYNDLPLALALMYGADEDFISESGRDAGYGASLMFDPGTGITAGIAYEQDMSVSGDIIRGSASVDLGKYIAAPVKLGVLYQEADYAGTTTATEDGLVVSAEMGLSNFARPASVYIQYDKTDNISGLENNDSNQVVVGGKYAFKNNMIAHAYAGLNSAELNNGRFGSRDEDGNVKKIDLRGDIDVLAIGGGLEYLF
ncbi:porin [uncultured Psychrobacter sp.]|uniref:porin n=1 Tax=uncultured Psychrobacter sp. TaxID=259303 RepID=UPI0025971EE0|nr:porin [uncultured Psychrobacter sp.]